MKLLAIVVAALIAVPRGGSLRQAKPKIVVFTKNVTNPFWKAVRGWAPRRRARRSAPTIETRGADQARQHRGADAPGGGLDRAQAGRDGFVFVPVDLQGAGARASRRANKAGIPGGGATTTACPTSSLVTYVGSDDETIGYEITKYLIKEIGGKGKIVHIDGVPAAITAQNRKKGLERALKEHPQVELLASQPGNYRRLPAVQVFENLMQRFPQIDGVVCANDDMAVGVAEALASARARRQDQGGGHRRHPRWRGGDPRRQDAGERGLQRPDPHVRKLAVWLPPQYDGFRGRRRFPVLYDLVGFTGSGLAHANWKPFGDNVPERAARLIDEQKMGPAIIVFPDCFTALGGNQYVNSSATTPTTSRARSFRSSTGSSARWHPARQHRGCFGNVVGRLRRDPARQCGEVPRSTGARSATTRATPTSTSCTGTTCRTRSTSSPSTACPSASRAPTTRAARRAAKAHRRRPHQALPRPRVEKGEALGQGGPRDHESLGNPDSRKVRLAHAADQHADPAAVGDRTTQGKNSTVRPGTKYVGKPSALQPDLRVVRHRGDADLREHAQVQQVVVAEPGGPLRKAVPNRLPHDQALVQLDRVALAVVEGDRLHMRVARQRPGEAGGRILPAGEQHQRVARAAWFVHRPLIYL